MDKEFKIESGRSKAYIELFDRIPFNGGGTEEEVGVDDWLEDVILLMNSGLDEFDEWMIMKVEFCLVEDELSK